MQFAFRFSFCRPATVGHEEVAAREGAVVVASAAELLAAAGDSPAALDQVHPSAVVLVRVLPLAAVLIQCQAHRLAEALVRARVHLSTAALAPDQVRPSVVAEALDDQARELALVEQPALAEECGREQASQELPETSIQPIDLCTEPKSTR